MLILRDPDAIACITDAEVRELVQQRFMDLSAEDEYDPDINGYLIIVEPFDGVDAVESESGCPILHGYCGTARFGDAEYKPVIMSVPAGRLDALRRHPAGRPLSRL